MPVAPVVTLTSNTTKFGVRGSNLGVFFFHRHQPRDRFIAWVSTNRCESTREKNAEIFSRKKKARTVVGRGGKHLLSDPGSELRLGREKKKKHEDNRHKGSAWVPAFAGTLAPGSAGQHLDVFDSIFDGE